jgi:hypothetical protein
LLLSGEILTPYYETRGKIMGDRANFGLKQHDGNTLYIYGHWAGEGMLTTFAHALDRASHAGRLPGDEAYSNRIIISQIVSNHDSDTGWGVTINYVTDNEYPIPVYDYSTDTVSMYDYDWETGIAAEPMSTVKREDFVAAALVKEA